LRDISQDSIGTPPPLRGERVPYAMLLSESRAIKSQLEHEQARLAHLRHLQDMHDRQNEYWRQVDEAVERGSGAGYDEAARVLVELREAAAHFQRSRAFEERYRGWVQPHLRRPAFVKRMQYHQFPLPAQ
jgi:hypothetical protein